jgi:hypothetical protein
MVAFFWDTLYIGVGTKETASASLPYWSTLLNTATKSTGRDQHDCPGKLGGNTHQAGAINQQ